MAFDFPNAPTIGQVATTPAGASFTWDGTKWVAGGAAATSISAGTGIAATPNPITGTGTIALQTPVSVANGGTGATTGNTGPYLPLVAGVGNPVTGGLQMAPAAADATINLQKPASGNNSAIFGSRGTTTRWSLILGDNSAESTGDLGSNLLVGRWTDAGVLIDTPLQIIRQTGAVAIRGTPNNIDASAGQVGEFVSSTVFSGSAVALSSGSGINVTSISLTAGDWDIDCQANFTGAAGTLVNWLAAGSNSISGTLSAPYRGLNTWNTGTAIFSGGLDYTVMGTPGRGLINVTTTIYLVVVATFSGGSCSAHGFLRARRRR